MADGNKYEEDLEAYQALCDQYGIEFDEDEADYFAMSVAIRVVDGGQDEETARIEQFKFMHGVRDDNTKPDICRVDAIADAAIKRVTEI